MSTSRSGEKSSSTSEANHCSDGPLVSVVTPVYNGERYLATCIESVLEQTYANWEYIIVDNQSTDSTPEIAGRYADRDARIRVHRNSEFLDMIPNWNEAMRQISPDSVYCKVVHADDLLLPECVAKTVALAEAHPAVGVVAAYRLVGKEVGSCGLPLETQVVSGREVAQHTLRFDYSLFGSPTSTLLRSELVRKRDEFYDPRFVHADKAICLALMEACDFGFVHQVLTCTGLHEDSHTTLVATRKELWRLENLLMLHEFGPRFFTSKEYRKQWRRALRNYYRFFGGATLSLRAPGLLPYHCQRLREHGIRFSLCRYAGAVTAQALYYLFSPLLFVSQIWKHVAGRR